MSNTKLSREQLARLEQWLNDEVVQQALDDVEQSYVDAWKESGLEDLDARENCYSMVLAVRELRRQLRAYVSNGRVSARRSRG